MQNYARENIFNYSLVKIRYLLLFLFTKIDVHFAHIEFSYIKRHTLNSFEQITLFWKSRTFFSFRIVSIKLTLCKNKSLRNCFNNIILFMYFNNVIDFLNESLLINPAITLFPLLTWRKIMREYGLLVLPFNIFFVV